MAAAIIFLLVFSSAIAWSAGAWVVERFGQIKFWIILEHITESPRVLPVSDLWLLIGLIAFSLALAALISAAFVVLKKTVLARYGRMASCVVSAVFVSAMIYESYGVFEQLDGWFSIRFEINCRRVRSAYFAKNLHCVEPTCVTFRSARRNLIVIVSESLEEGFTEGVLCGENLLPELTEWRNGALHFNCQVMVDGASFTSAALTSMMYGIPRHQLNADKNLMSYPKYSVPSIWDVFLANGYNCMFVHGGDFEFGSIGRLLPEHEHFKRIGYDDLKNEPDFLRERNPPRFGINDEVLFTRLKIETERLARADKPFALMTITTNSHGPEGWRSAFAEPSGRGILADSILTQDRLISGYIKWLKAKGYDQNTVIVVLGDHHYWGREWRGKSARRVFNAVEVPKSASLPTLRNRPFATFDWAPTFIELAGGELPGEGRFGMGVSLLRETTTLMETVAVEDFNREMQSSLTDYRKLVFLLGVREKIRARAQYVFDRTAGRLYQTAEEFGRVCR